MSVFGPTDTQTQNLPGPTPGLDPNPPLIEPVEPNFDTGPETTPESLEVSPESPETPPEVTPFDNEILLLYKWGRYFQYPIKYIVSRKITETQRNELDPRIPQTISILAGEQLLFEPLTSIISRMLDDGVPLREIIESISEISSYASVDDIIMLYVNLQLARNPNLSYADLLPLINQYFAEVEAEKQTALQNPPQNAAQAPALNVKLPMAKRFRDANDLRVRYEDWVNQFTLQFQRDMRILDRKLIVLNELVTIVPLAVSPLTIDKVSLRLSPSLKPKTGLPPVNLDLNPSPDLELHPDANLVPEQILLKDDGIDMFNAAQLSHEVPFIQYNTVISSATDEIRHKYYKIYQGESEQTTPKYANIVPNRTKTNAPNTLYATIWTQETVEQRANRTIKTSYTPMIYDLTSNSMSIDVPIHPTQDESVVLQRVASALPTVELGPATEVKVNGNFDLYDVELSDVALMDIILNEPLVNTYLYVEESQKSRADKDRVYIHYKSLAGDVEEGETSTGEGYISNTASVSINIKQMATAPDQKVTIAAPTPTDPLATTQVTYPGGTPYIHVQIMKATTREIAKQFIEVFRRLMQFYKDHRDPVDEYYEAFIPELTAARIQTIALPPVQRARPGAPTVKPGGSRLKKLEEYAPDVIAKNYARDCQSLFQPEPIAFEEIETWKARTFSDNGTETERQILSFPRDNPRYYFVCPDDQHPYPGVKLNVRGKNKEEFPYIPCCYGTDQMEPDRKTKYNEYYNNVRREVVAAAKTNPLSLRRILEPGRRGQLPKMLSELLMRYSQAATEIMRFGIVRSLNSLIHAVLFAIEFPAYMNLPDDTGPNVISPVRAAYILYIRSVILAMIRPAVVKQEMYDFTEAEIEAKLADPSIYFDPSYYYRALEELFNINIYVFSPSELPNDEVGGRVRFPRFKFFHSRPPRLERQTVLIYEHLGTEAERAEYPQCELIVDYDKDSNTFIKIFGPDMTSLVHGTMFGTQTNITWRIRPQENPDGTVNAIVNSINLYSRVDFARLIRRQGGLTLTSQILDDYGKLRALIIPTNIGPMTLCVPPSQPENLPISPEIYSLPIEAPVSLMGDPIAVTRNEIGATPVEGPPGDQVGAQPVRSINGLWYPVMDLEFGVYVPVTDEKGLQSARLREKPPGLPNPLAVKGPSVVDRLKTLQRTLNLILQLMRWLYTLAQVTAPPNEPQTGEATVADPRLRQNFTPADFYNRYFGLKPPQNNETIDSATVYDFSRIPRKFPGANEGITSIAEALNYLERLAPTFVQGGRVIFYNQTFADKVYGRLVEFDKLNRPLPVRPLSLYLPGMDWVVPREIEDYYMDEGDFRQQPHVAVFTNERDIQLWLASMIAGTASNIVIKNRLDASYALLEEPYLYRAADGKIYLIQNVYGGDFLRAITVANTWYIEKVNEGLMAPPYEGDLPVHAIYGISPDGVPIARVDQSYESAQYLQLLLYGDRVDVTAVQAFRAKKVEAADVRRYAAMLPLI